MSLISSRARGLLQAENFPRFTGAGRVAVEFKAGIDDLPDQFRIAVGKAGLIIFQIVFKSGPHMATQFKAPARYRQLMATNAGGGPSGTGHKLV